MREIKVIGMVILSNHFCVEKIDLPGTKEDNINRLKSMGVSQETLEDIDINNGTEDIVGKIVHSGERVAFEAKGTTKKNYGNFKYWGKGMINQMAQLDDKTDAESVGIAIPEEVADVLRGIMSSHNSTVSEEESSQIDATEIYGERQSSVLKQYDNDDYVILANSDGITVQEWKLFFGLR